MHAILAKIANYLLENDYKFDELGDHRLLLKMTDGVISWCTDICLIEEEEARALVLITWLPVLIPREKWRDAASLLTALNFNSCRPNFHMDPDGNIACCTNQLVGKYGLPTTCISTFLNEHFARVMLLFPGLIRLALDDTPTARPAEDGSPTCQENDRLRLN